MSGDLFASGEVLGSFCVLPLGVFESGNSDLPSIKSSGSTIGQSPFAC